jgi:hypothetical protein
VTEVLTDHNNLIYFRKPHKLNRRQARWFAEMSDYNIKLIHHAGVLNKGADALSRLPHYDQGEEDNEEVTVLPDYLFKFVVTDGDEKKRIIASHHNSLLGGHLGKKGTAELIECSYTWNGLREQVGNYIEECDLCQRTKARNQLAGATLHPHVTPNDTWEEVSVDFVGPLLILEKYDFIAVFVDRLTKMVHYVPCNSNITAQQFACLFLNTVIRAHGIPKRS